MGISSGNCSLLHSLATWDRARETMAELAWEIPRERRFSADEKKGKTQGPRHCRCGSEGATCLNTHTQHTYCIYENTRVFRLDKYIPVHYEHTTHTIHLCNIINARMYKRIHIDKCKCMNTLYSTNTHVNIHTADICAHSTQNCCNYQ